jgi:hypothetical protein
MNPSKQPAAPDSRAEAHAGAETGGQPVICPARASTRGGTLSDIQAKNHNRRTTEEGYA